MAIADDPELVRAGQAALDGRLDDIDVYLLLQFMECPDANVRAAAIALADLAISRALPLIVPPTRDDIESLKNDFWDKWPE